MNVIPASCPDDRIVLARRGAVDAAEWESLMAHVQTCADCRAAWLVARSFEGTASRQPDDDEVVERAVRVALGSPKAGAVIPRRVRRPATVVAASVILVAGAASAAALIKGHLAIPVPVLLDREPAAPEPGKTRTSHRAIRGIPSVRPPATTAQDEEEPQPLSVITTTPHLARARPSQARCAELFARATAERGAGRPTEAIASFRRLESECPGTPEARVSLVSVGELLADGRDLKAALDSFEAYLRQVPSGPLAPEALAAKARLLDRLGKKTEADWARIQLRHRIPEWPYTSDHRDESGSRR